MSTRPPAGIRGAGQSHSGRWTSLTRRRLTRRSLLSASVRAGVGAAGLALVGCSDDEEPPQQETPEQDQPPEPQELQQQSIQQEQTEPAEQQAAQPEPPSGPQPGGIVRAWLPVERIDRWDPHRSRYRYTQAVHSLMYSRLLRPARESTGELRPDISALPEMPDESTFVFNLNQGAVFWDLEPTNGRAVTAQDIGWNITRQQDALDAAGLPDPFFFRSTAYQRTASVETTSDSSITLTTSEPDAAYLGSVHASPFAWITSPEAAELYADDWRDDPSDIMRNSGSGPYTPRLYNGFEITLARSDNWWQADSAYPDGITFTSGDTNNIVSLYDAAALDRADFPLTNDAVEALREQNPEHTAFELPLDAAVELLTPLGSDPLTPMGDPRVIRAVSLAVDRRALLKRLYGERGRLSGPLPWYLGADHGGWGVADEILESFPGYRDDRAADLEEVAQLIGAAGLTASSSPLPLVVADIFEGFFPGSGEAVRSMIAEATGLEVRLENRPFAEAVDQLRGGERFLFLGWGGVPERADPTDDWRRTLHSTGEQHWSDDTSPELDALIDQMRVTFDQGERQELAHDVQELLLSGEAVQWRVNLFNGIQLGIHQPWLNPDPNLFDFAWTTDRLSTSWLDTTLESYPTGRELPPLEEETDEGG